MGQNTNLDQDNQTSTPKNELLEEIQNLGENLRTVIKSAWESEERKHLQRDIEVGLNELFSSLSKNINEFSESPTGRELKSDLEDLGDRLKSGEIETNVRNEIVNALRAANVELKKAAEPKENSTTSDRSEDS